MIDQQQQVSIKAGSFLRPQSAFIAPMCTLIALIFTLSACTGVTSNPPTTLVANSLSQTSTSSTTYPVKVYFSKFSESDSAVFPISRLSPTIEVGTFSIQLLIAGPTPEERNQGYYSELNSILSGPSNCSNPYPTGGPDFKLVLNKKGSVSEQGTATLRFCRNTSSPGVGADARITAEINATLKQFSSIKKVVILTKDGHCFGDESGLDQCLH